MKKLNDKLAYSFTDLSGNLLYVTMSTYIMYFYTDVFGLSVGVVGTLLLVTRLIDGFDAPMWGMIIDKTNSKYGKSRPYFLWLAFPFAISVILVFTTPDISTNFKIVYASITYIVANIIYSGIQTSITSILPNLSNNDRTRLTLNSFRMVGGNVGNFIAVTFLLPLVAILGQGNDKLGFVLTISLFGLVVVMLLVYAFFNLKEINIGNTKKMKFWEGFKAIKGNWPWIILIVANVFFWVAQTSRNSMVVYYFKYNMGDEKLVPFINGISILQVVGMIFIVFLSSKIKKTGTMILGLLLASIGQLGVYVASEELIYIVIFWSIGCIGSGIAVSMPFAMLSDTVDYGEWKTKIRASGILTAIGSAFCIKFGSGIGGFLPSKIMEFTNYSPGEKQSELSLLGIQWGFIWLPIITFVLASIIMIFYFNYEKKEYQIKQALKLREE